MAVSARLEQSSLDMQIQQEMRSPIPDTLRISQLKKQKLQIKDMIKNAGTSARA